MIILGSLLSLIVVIIIPFPTMGDPFKLEGVDGMTTENITKVKLMVCGVLGLLTNGLIIAIYE
jgi:hypothetical protein